MNTADRANGSLKTDIIVYVTILALSGLQIVLAYHSTGRQLLIRMLVLAVLQAGLGVKYFMHLLDERRSLRLALIPGTGFVLLMMNMIWSDSFRLLHMHPFVK